MPIFEYQCQDCEKPFEAFVTSDRRPECPACHGTNLAKLLSSPGMVGAGNGRTESAGACATPAMPGCGMARAGASTEPVEGRALRGSPKGLRYRPANPARTTMRPRPRGYRAGQY